MATQPQRHLETFPNPAPDRDYTIAFDCPEFTCLCPLTGQPDFAHFTITYVPDRACVELKSLKLYLWSFRDQGAFHEKVTNAICDDVVKACKPRRLTVHGKWYVRGGIATDVTVTYQKRAGRR
jgi:7-cyano-7-deazaguanine reductase